MECSEISVYLCISADMLTWVHPITYSSFSQWNPFFSLLTWSSNLWGISPSYIHCSWCVCLKVRTVFIWVWLTENSWETMFDSCSCPVVVLTFLLYLNSILPFDWCPHIFLCFTFFCVSVCACFLMWTACICHSVFLTCLAHGFTHWASGLLPSIACQQFSCFVSLVLEHKAAKASGHKLCKPAPPPLLPNRLLERWQGQDVQCVPWRKPCL